VLASGRQSGMVLKQPAFRSRNVSLAQNTLKRALRDEHKAHTERTLRDAALKLFASQGYDTTTIDEIAEKAGVSARTFFRYFPTKESVLYLHERLWFQSLTEIYLSQPRSLSDVEALKATFVDQAPALAVKRKSLQLYTRALASSTTLRGRKQDRHKEDTDELARAVATRRGVGTPDEACFLLAAVSLLAHMRALDAWIENDDGLDLSERVVREMDILAELFQSHTVPTS
jgi:AcrR family transcriptional regulator